MRLRGTMSNLRGHRPRAAEDVRADNVYPCYTHTENPGDDYIEHQGTSGDLC